MTMDFLQFYTDTPQYTHPPGLDVMRRLCARLGDPQDTLRCVHIAGTNGKGSCAAMTAAVLRAAGYRTGLYTSPDLAGPWERIAVDRVYITLSDFAAVTEEVKAACQGPDEPTYFEKMTAAAFLYFARQQCDYVVLETGLGGRMDATNIIKDPVCSVITPIGMDHTAQLGDTLSAIAGEKAGIIKPGCPVVCAPQPIEAEAAIQARCEAVGAPLHKVDITKIQPQGYSILGQWFSYGEAADMTLSLLGRHQVDNACTVMEACRVLGIDEVAVRTGLFQAKWPCRFEVVRCENHLFVLDGAHNPQGTAALVKGLREYFPGRKFTVVMGVMRDKNWREMLRIISPLARRFIFVDLQEDRSLRPELMTQAVAPIRAQIAGDVRAALLLCGAYDEPVCAFGSLHYIGHLRKLLVDEPS